MKVLIACGGTAGHIFPALRLSEELYSKRKDIETVLVVGKRDIEERIIPNDYKVIRLDASTIKLVSFKELLMSFFKIFKTSLKSMLILLRFKPDLVIGFGGYASFFLVFFAWLLRIKTIIHEENILMGRANRLLSPFVDYISIGFKQTKEFFPLYRNKMVFTGNPLRKEFKIIEKKEASRYFDFSSDCFTILVMGGSQGAHRINIEFLKAVLLLKDKVLFQVIHLSGEKDFDFLNKEYKNIDIIKVKLFKFLEPMHYAFSAADLVISRAGAMTISELIFFKLPVIIIPYPYAYRHQVYNASILRDNRCAILIEEDNLTSEVLAESIMGLIKSPQKLIEMRANYDKLLDSFQRDLWDLVLSFN
jgi:UDP-N-acetylglucosamine--N-acetylmuramyl-(pentapeptide) pyrophosphoryl-undecaprenol N-acetylglucosamine transferase